MISFNKSILQFNIIKIFANSDIFFDMYDDLNYGEVIYNPYLTSPANAGPR